MMKLHIFPIFFLSQRQQKVVTVGINDKKTKIGLHWSTCTWKDALQIFQDKETKHKPLWRVICVEVIYPLSTDKL